MKIQSSYRGGRVSDCPTPFGRGADVRIRQVLGTDDFTSLLNRQIDQAAAQLPIGGLGGTESDGTGVVAANVILLEEMDCNGRQLGGRGDSLQSQKGEPRHRQDRAQCHSMAATSPEPPWRRDPSSSHRKWYGRADIYYTDRDTRGAHLASCSVSTPVRVAPRSFS